jgi:hypothetical protein
LKRSRSKLTYANVMSSIAVFLVVAGGTAFAATEMLPTNSVGMKQIKKEAVTPAKLSKASKATLTGPKGATGSNGAAGAQGPKGDRGEKGETGAAGSSLAYARVEETGKIDTTQSKGIGAMTVTVVGTGEYCITGLPFEPKNVVASSQFFTRGVNTFVGKFSKCPAGTQVSYETWGSTANASAPVMILFN